MRLKLKNLNEQVMVITGASSGIGLATARMAAQRGAKLVQGRHRPPARGRAAYALDEALLRDPILRGGERARRGADRHALGEPFDRRGGDILELVGDDVAGGGEVREHDAVMIIGARQARRGLRGDAFSIGGEDVGAVAEPGGSDGDHPPELPAAEDADR